MFTKNWKLKSAIVGITLINFFTPQVFSQLNIDKGFLSADSFKGHFKSGSTIIPHPDKAHKGGEDALMVKERLISIADGVGGWANQGIDPGLYSKQLEKYIGEEFDKSPEATPKEILASANKRTTHVGTSTWVIAILHPQNQSIATTYLGDSSYMLLRPQNGTLEKLFRSKEQQKSFNFPFQWGTGGDDPSLGIDNHHEVHHNDIIVMGSDGVFDNWFDEEIMEIVQKGVQKDNINDAKQISDQIGELSSVHGHDKEWRSPFQIEAEKAYRRRVFAGGKLDDISVIVSQIKFEE